MKARTKLRPIALATLVSACFSLGIGLPGQTAAYAVATPPPVESDSIQNLVPIGETAVFHTGATCTDPDMPCITEVDTTQDPPALATAAQLAGAKNLVNADGVKLGDVAATSSTIWTYTWSQWAFSGWQSFGEKHAGRVYYDGTYVWTTSSYRGYAGWHVCDLGWSIGWDITCQKVDDGKTTGKNQSWDFFKVHIIYKGVPGAIPYDMHVNFYPSGNAYYHWGSGVTP